MKSFRIDTDSVNDAVESWPALLIALAISATLAYWGWLDAACRATLVAFGAIYFGYVLRGALTRGVRSKYPNASCLWLLSIGLTSATLGVIVRMLFPSLQGGLTDYVWLAVSFLTILSFALINRHDPDVLT